MVNVKSDIKMHSLDTQFFFKVCNHVTIGEKKAPWILNHVISYSLASSLRTPKNTRLHPILSTHYVHIICLHAAKMLHSSIANL